MKNYTVSLSKRVLLLSGTLTIFTACDDGGLGDTHKGNSSGEYASDVNWTDVADKGMETYIKYFYENVSGRNTFCGSIYWEEPNTPEIGEPASTGGSDGWSRGHVLDIVINVYIHHANNPEYQAHLYENTIKPFLPASDGWNEHCGYGDKDFWNNFYDSTEWMALSCLRAYELTDDQDYYSALMKMWNHIKGAKNDYKEVRGMAWKTDMPVSCISCSDDPGCLLAMKLYRLTVKEAKDGWEEQAAYYLNFVKEVYNWMTVYLYDISTGQVYDNLSTKDDGTPGDPDKMALSYNQGTFMAAVLELYNTTGEDGYLRNTVAFGSYQMNKKMNPSYSVFSGEGNSEDDLLFRGISVRYFLDMVKQPTNSLYPGKAKNKFIAALCSCSDMLWTLAHPEGYYAWEYDWAKAPTFGSRDNREDRLTISLSAEVPGAITIEIYARYEDRVQGKATKKTNWVGPDLGKKAEE